MVLLSGWLVAIPTLVILFTLGWPSMFCFYGGCVVVILLDYLDI